MKETRYILFGQNFRCFWWPPMDALEMWPNVSHNSYRIVHVTWSLTNDLAPPLFHPICHGVIKDHLGHLHLSADRESVRPIVFFTLHGIIRGTASSSSSLSTIVHHKAEITLIFDIMLSIGQGAQHPNRADIGLKLKPSVRQLIAVIKFSRMNIICQQRA